MAELEPGWTPDLSWLLAELNDRAPYRALHASYYRGQHRLVFASQRWRSTFGELFESLRDNLCRGVVDAVADRLELERFTGPGAASVMAVWDANRLDRTFGATVLDALRAGDGFMLAWPRRDGTPGVWRQDPTTFTVRYAEDADAPGTMDLAGKLWRLRDKRWRANLYYPDRLVRLITKGPQDTEVRAAHFELVADELTPEGVAVNGYGRVPVGHFANGADVGELGVSELEDVVPLQDALNKTLADFLVAGEFLGYPQRYALGVEGRIDPLTGQEQAPKPGPGELWWSSNKDAQLGQLAAADPGPLLSAMSALRGEISTVAGVPPYVLGLIAMGDPPSGESLKVLEARLTRKVKDRAIAFGDTAEELLAMAAGAAKLELEAVWAPPATRDELNEAAVVAARYAIHQSRTIAMRELGYSEEEIAEADDDRRAAAATQADAAIASFLAGGPAAAGLGGMGDAVGAALG